MNRCDPLLHTALSVADVPRQAASGQRRKSQPRRLRCQLSSWKALWKGGGGYQDSGCVAGRRCPSAQVPLRASARASACQFWFVREGQMQGRREKGELEGGRDRDRDRDRDSATDIETERRESDRDKDKDKDIDNGEGTASE